jgi:hypothetical protein
MHPLLPAFKAAIEADGFVIRRTDEEGRMFFTDELFFAVFQEGNDSAMFQVGLFEDGEESFAWHGNTFSSTIEGALRAAESLVVPPDDCEVISERGEWQTFIQRREEMFDDGDYY